MAPPNNEKSIVVEKYGRTKWQEVDVHYVFMISNFKYFHSALYSPTFFANGHESIKFRLQIKEINDWISISVISCGNTDINFGCQLSIINFFSEETNVTRISPIHKITHCLTADKFIKKPLIFDRSRNMLLDGELRIMCKIRFAYLNISPLPDQYGVEQFGRPKSMLIQNFDKLIGNDQFSDVTLLLDGREIPAHKSILAARSKIFAAMFDVDEFQMDCIVIKDIRYEVFQEVLRFVYTGRIENLKEMVAELLFAANKYGLEELKTLCQIALCNKLSYETAVEMLILADKHNAVQLKGKALNAIVTHANKVILTQKWKNMTAEHPHLVVEAFSKLAVKSS